MIPMSAPLRFGILGYARIARLHLIPAMLEAKNAIPYAIASTNPEKLFQAQADFPFQKAFDNYDSLLADPNVDAVYIPLPNSLHKEWTIKAAKAKKHVLCEKPMALNEDDCLDMIAACRENGVKLMEAFMYRFTLKTAKLKELLAAKVIGDMKHIHSTFRFVMRPGPNIRLDPQLGGGSLWDVGCYPVNLIGMIMQDEPVSVCAMKADSQGVEYALDAVLKYKNGVICTLGSGFDSNAAQLTEINGTEGTLLVQDTFDGTGMPILLYKNGAVTEIPVPDSKRYVLEIEDFSDAVLTNREPSFALSETVRNIRLINRILSEAQ
jgi:D-xylose 1-dehydrogenase (NADP+, D-xylono-1,5-lactone-forming)